MAESTRAKKKTDVNDITIEKLAAAHFSGMVHRGEGMDEARLYFNACLEAGRPLDRREYNFSEELDEKLFREFMAQIAMLGVTVGDEDDEV